MRDKVDVVNRVTPVPNLSSESRVESEKGLYPLSQWLWPAGGVSTAPVPAQCPICDVMLPILRTRANCSRALQAPAQNDQTWGFVEPHLQRPWRLVWCGPLSAAEWAETPDSQASCSPEPQSRERGLSPACPLPSRALPAGSPKSVGTREHTCSHKR